MSNEQKPNVLFLLKNRGVITSRSTTSLPFDWFGPFSILTCVPGLSMILPNLRSITSYFPGGQEHVYTDVQTDEFKLIQNWMLIKDRKYVYTLYGLWNFRMGSAIVLIKWLYPSSFVNMYKNAFKTHNELFTNELVFFMVCLQLL